MRTDLGFTNSSYRYDDVNKQLHLHLRAPARSFLILSIFITALAVLVVLVAHRFQ
jgi:hypothetical protein